MLPAEVLRVRSDHLADVSVDVTLRWLLDSRSTLILYTCMPGVGRWLKLPKPYHPDPGRPPHPTRRHQFESRVRQQSGSSGASAVPYSRA